MKWARGGPPHRSVGAGCRQRVTGLRTARLIALTPSFRLEFLNPFEDFGFAQHSLFGEKLDQGIQR